MDNRKNILIISIIFIFFSIFFYSKTGNVLIDFSRESYIPFEMNNYGKLIKDIFLIYGPFGYIINSFLYKISLNINMLLVLAHIISYFCAILFYFIIVKFEKPNLALVFTIFFIAISLFSNSTFSFVMPYSYSTLWAVFAIYLVLYSLFYNKNKILFLSLGLILSNKIEMFFLILFISLWYLIYKKNFSFKDILYIAIFPIISYSYIFINSIGHHEIINDFIYIKKMMSTNAISYLYKGMGTFFEKKYFIYNIINLGKILSIFTISLIFYKKNMKYLSYTIFAILLLFVNTNFLLNLIILLLLPIVIYLFYKKKIQTEELILFAFAIMLCSKAIFAINPFSYSNFGYMLMIFVLYLQLIKILDKNLLQKMFTIFLTLNFIVNLAYYFLNYKEKIQTNIGNIYVNKNDYENFINVNNYIEKNIKNNENFLVIPEGQIFNLIHKKPYGFYNSTFTPLDFETFGEKNLIEKLNQEKPDFIIFFPRDTEDYGKKTICKNYAVDFCSFIKDNYIKKTTFGSVDNINIYKIKNK